MRRSLTALGIEIRAGLHTGECEVTDKDIVGMAVHLAARIQAAAAPGEVLVSSTVRIWRPAASISSRTGASISSRASKNPGGYGPWADARSGDKGMLSTRPVQNAG